jgi:hypothetical protein
MIITRLNGGLGNQLFQYAVGRHLAEINKTHLKIDTSLLSKNNDSSLFNHKYALWPFNIKEDFASEEEVNKLTRSNLFIRYIYRKLGMIGGLKSSTNIVEKQGFKFEPEILRLKNNVCLSGYWQTEKYFINIEKIIRQELSFNLPQKDRDREIAAHMNTCSSVSIHFRRGYLITDKNNVHGVLDYDYYHRCIERLTHVVKNPHFFIFSDDHEWVKKNVRLTYPTTIIAHNGLDKHYEDLRLMSQCKHHIIANSSFSWWSAWLNPRKDKIIYAPTQWLTDKNCEINDLYPVSWYKI